MIHYVSSLAKSMLPVVDDVDEAASVGSVYDGVGAASVGSVYDGVGAASCR